MRNLQRSHHQWAAREWWTIQRLWLAACCSDFEELSCLIRTILIMDHIIYILQNQSLSPYHMLPIHTFLHWQDCPQPEMKEILSFNIWNKLFRGANPVAEFQHMSTRPWPLGCFSNNVPSERKMKMLSQMYQLDAPFKPALRHGAWHQVELLKIGTIGKIGPNFALEVEQS